MAQWYYKTSNDERGPLSFEELGFLKNRGRLSPKDLVRKGKNGSWTRAGTVKGLFPSELVTRSKMSPAALLAESNSLTHTSQVNETEPEGVAAAEIDNALPETTEQDAPPARPFNNNQRSKRITIGTNIGAGIAVLLLLLLALLLWPSDGTGGRGGGFIPLGHPFHRRSPCRVSVYRRA